MGLATCSCYKLPPKYRWHHQIIGIFSISHINNRNDSISLIFTDKGGQWSSLGSIKTKKYSYSPTLTFSSRPHPCIADLTAGWLTWECRPGVSSPSFYLHLPPSSPYPSSLSVKTTSFDVEDKYTKDKPKDRHKDNEHVREKALWSRLDHIWNTSIFRPTVIHSLCPLHHCLVGEALSFLSTVVLKDSSWL